MENAIEVVRKLYPDYVEGGWISERYQPIIDILGTVAVKVEDDGYSGDIRVLYADSGKGIGYLQVGYGSCSGCDRLLSCSSIEEIAELVEELESSVQWKPITEMYMWFLNHDWEGDYSWNDDNQKEFVASCLEYMLGKMTGGK